MLFTSFEFVAFLACVLGLYYLIPVRFQWVLLLVANVFFYARSGLYGLLFMGVTIVTSYAAARIMSAVQYHMDDTVKAHKEVWSKQERKAYKQQIKRKKRMIFIGCLLVNLGILAVLKYTNFAIANVNGIAALFTGRHSIARVNLVLPLGISFYTFQTMGYVIDVYRGKAEAEKNIFKMALFTSFFPQLIQGPISRFGELSQTLYAPHRFDFRTVWFGLERVLWGYFKKVVIADRLNVLVNTVYGAPAEYEGLALIIATLCFTVQIYCDFSGYSDIARGCAGTMGIELINNFDRPYFSKSIREFWRRWHISLSSWFKDYLYIPLGGNRVSIPRQWLNYMITFMVSGLWHGASWTFVVWGALHGFYQIIGNIKYRIFGKQKFKFFLTDFISMLITFALIAFAWIFFKANNISDGIYIVSHLLDNISAAADVQYLYEVLNGMGLNFFELVLMAGAVFYLILCEIISFKYEINELMLKVPFVFRFAFYYVTAVMIIGMGVFSSGGDFIYFQF